LEPEPTAVRSIDSTRISAASLARMWTEAVQPRRAEADIASAMAMVDDRIEDIICVDTRGERGWSSFLVGLRGQATRVPLGSLGEGAGRLLGLAVTSVAARGGTLLVDEIDTGLHHSVFDAFWPWLIDRATSAATRFQLFATTHSEDCVRGLARAVAESKQRADSVSLHRMVPDEDTTRRFSGQLLVSAVESFLEVR
jgi:predicted ATPase